MQSIFTIHNIVFRSIFLYVKTVSMCVVKQVKRANNNNNNNNNNDNDNDNDNNNNDN